MADMLLSKKESSGLLLPLFGLVLIPGLLLLAISVVSISNQQGSKILQLNDRLKGDCTAFAEFIYKRLEQRFSENIAQISALDRGTIGDPKKLISIMMKMGKETPEMKFPFIVNSRFQYLFPPVATPTLGKSETISTVTDLLSASLSPQLRKLYREAERAEYQTHSFLLAIHHYLQVLKGCRTPKHRALIRYAIARCYKKNGGFNQAIAYQEDVKRILEGSNVTLYPLEFRALYDMAQSHEALNLNATDMYLDLYEKILKFERLHQSGEFSSLKNGIEYRLKDVKRVTEKQADTTEATEPTRPVIRYSGLGSSYTDPSEAIMGRDSGDRSGVLSESLTSERQHIRLNRIRDFYLSNDEKTNFYRYLKDRLMRMPSDADSPETPHYLSVSGSGVVHNTLVLTLKDPENGDLDLFFGYTISEAQLFEWARKHFSSEFRDSDGIRYKMLRRSSEVDPYSLFFRLHSIPLSRYIKTHELVLGANRDDFITTEVNESLKINYLITLFIFFILVAGVLLFIGVVRRERALLRMKKEFIDSVSHTLKTPLTRIRLLAEKMELGWTSGKKDDPQGLVAIQTETDLMAESIDNMIGVSRIDAGGVLYKPDCFDPYPVISKWYEQYSPYLSSRGFENEFHGEDGLPDIRFDRESLKMIFINLLQNSVKYAAEVKRVSISLALSEGGKEVFLGIEDRGVGIPEKELDAVCKKYVRGSEPGVRSVEGSGLGLYLIRHAVKAQKGSLKIVNRKGGGLAVRVGLPICAEER